MDRSAADMQSLLVLRKLTRAIADVARDQLVDYLTTLTPLMRAETVLGNHVHGGRRDSSRRPDQVLKELQSQYDGLASTKPLNLQRALAVPLEFSGSGLEISPVEYIHEVRSAAHTKKIVVRRPLIWTLTYSGLTPVRLQEALEAKVRAPEVIQRFVVGSLIMQTVLKHQAGIGQVLEALHFPLTVTTTPEFGNLPIVRIGVPIETERPSDAVVLQSAELTGMDAFEEVVRLEDVSRLPTPFKTRLVEIARAHAPESVSG
jgi:hypothetical protein